MQHICDRDAAGEIVINRGVFGIQNVADIHHRGDREAAFIHVAADGDVRMAINNPRQNKFAAGVDHRRAIRRYDAGADFGDFAIANQDRAVFDIAVRDGEDRGVLDQRDVRFRVRPAGARHAGRSEENEKTCGRDCSCDRSPIHRPTSGSSSDVCGESPGLPPSWPPGL